MYLSFIFVYKIGTYILSRDGSFNIKYFLFFIQYIKYFLCQVRVHNCMIIGGQSGGAQNYSQIEPTMAT